MSTNKCSCNDCNLDVWKMYDKCVLHCPKNNYQNDIQDNTLSSFYTAFKQYIIDTLKIENTCDNEEVDAKFVTGEITVSNLEKIDLKDCFIAPKSIVFPERDSRDIFDYLKILNQFGEICFKYCEFYTTYLKLLYTKVFFQDCIFHNSWGLYDYKVLENIDNVTYQACHFEDSVTMYRSQEEEKGVKLLCSQFDYTCRFGKNLELTGIEVEQAFFNTNQTTNYLEDNKVKSMQFVDCTFKHKFILNNYTIDNFKIEKCLFKNKLEFKKNSILKFEIDDSNFSALVDFYRTNFIEFRIYKSIFEDFVGFEKTSFGLVSSNVALFEYVTFLNFTNFRSTRFRGGLDIENINLKEYPNFLNATINYDNTNRETFRIIKQSFDKIGNSLEGNLYFSLEMKKYREELSLKPLKGNLQEKFIFWVNEKTSNFGQSFVLPIVWLIILAMIYGVIIYGNEQNWLENISPCLSSALDMIVHYANSFVKNIQPLSKLLKENYEFVSLIFYIAFSVLIWQTIVAVKRHTKR